MDIIWVGFHSQDRNAIKRALEESLGITFEARESFYIGEYEAFPPAAAKTSNSEEIVLRNNLDPRAGEPEWPRAAEYKVILIIDQTSRPEYFKHLSETLGGHLLTAAQLR